MLYRRHAWFWYHHHHHNSLVKNLINLHTPQWRHFPPPFRTSLNLASLHQRSRPHFRSSISCPSRTARLPSMDRIDPFSRPHQSSCIHPQQINCFPVYAIFSRHLINNLSLYIRLSTYISRCHGRESSHLHATVRLAIHSPKRWRLTHATWWHLSTRVVSLPTRREGRTVTSSSTSSSQL